MNRNFIKLVNYTPLLLLALLGLASCATTPEERAAQAREDHEEWLAEENEREQERIALALENRDVTLGMGMRDVADVWGEPSQIEAAGESRRHQRWIYYTGLSSTWSLGSARAVYFENGRVIGWETLAR